MSPSLHTIPTTYNPLWRASKRENCTFGILTLASLRLMFLWLAYLEMWAPAIQAKPQHSQKIQGQKKETFERFRERKYFLEHL